MRPRVYGPAPPAYSPRVTVLLVSAPWRTPDCSGLALGTLRPILEADGIAVDTLYGSLLFPWTARGLSLTNEHAAFLFALQLPGASPDRIDSAIAALYQRYMTLDGIFDPTRHSVAFEATDTASSRRMLDERTAARVREFRADVDRARVCLDRCFERASRPGYDIIGLSATFETQVPAAVALAQRLKAHDPERAIIFGGAACYGEQAEGIIASFPEIDVVCHTEGDRVIAPLVRALRGERDLSTVGGIVYRGPGGRVVRTPSPPPVQDLDELPIPHFDDFAAQHQASEWRATPPRIFFETARGCWWGEKSLCSFCGLNTEGLAFRAKSADRAYREIEALYRRYPQAALLQGTDNILDMRYFRTVLPRLASMAREPERPLRIFYEIKSNLRPEQLALMARAGVVDVQPGIESFHDEILKLMRKGATGLQQIAFLKWAYQSGVGVTYNLLIRNPGEQAAWYREMVGLLDYLGHLPPPDGVSAVYLERYSPYFTEPEAFGISDVRPRPYYSALFGNEADLDRLAYMFDFHHELHDDLELRAVHREVVAAVHRWVAGWGAWLAWFVAHDRHLLLVDRRGGRGRTSVVSGLAARVWRQIDRPRRRRGLGRSLPEVAPELLDCLLDTWQHQRWAVRDDSGRCLSLLPERRPSGDASGVA